MNGYVWWFILSMANYPMSWPEAVVWVILILAWAAIFIAWLLYEK